MTAATLSLGLVCSAVLAAPSQPQQPTPLILTASAYAIDGITKSGTDTDRGHVAADPRVLPLGTRIRISGAGAYSGEYLVTDTGAKIKGKRIDIFVKSKAEAKHFGKRRVRVQVLRYGTGEVTQAEADLAAANYARQRAFRDSELVRLNLR